MAQTSAGHVFISYSRKDEAAMHRIAIFLQERGISAWVDREDLEPGSPIWEAEIEKAIKRASAMIVMLSPDSKNSKWVLSEITFAEQNKVRIFPVLVRGDEETSIPIRLITYQYVDIRRNEDVGLDKLLTELRRYPKEPQPLEEPIEEKQKRILEAAIEKEVTVGKATQLFVLIRRLDSKGIISVIRSVDEEVVLDESNVKSKELQIEFPIERGRIGPASISLRLTARDFSPSQQVKHINIPPDGDSEIVTFMLVPKAAGTLILQLEVLVKETSLISRTIRTTAIEASETSKVKLLYSMPIVILVQHSSQVSSKTEKSRQKEEIAAKIQAKAQIIAALIGAAALILVAYIGLKDTPSIPGINPSPTPTFSPPPTVTPSATFTPTPLCRPSGNQSPTITLKLEPVSVKVYGTAELTITVSDPEHDPYEILAITAQKGQFPNGKEEPYVYEAPGFPDKDIITVWVRDHGCTSKEEIKVNIQQ